MLRALRSLLLCGVVALPAEAAPSPWAQLTVVDVERFHRSVVDFHPGTMSDADRGAMFGAYGVYNAASEKAGILRGLNLLQGTAAATSISMRDGEAVIHDGPFVQTKEALGGYYVIDVPDLDDAIAWAKQCSGAAYGGVEIRPVLGTV